MDVAASPFGVQLPVKMVVTTMRAQYGRRQKYRVAAPSFSIQAQLSESARRRWLTGAHKEVAAHGAPAAPSQCGRVEQGTAS